MGLDSEEERLLSILFQRRVAPSRLPVDAEGLHRIKNRFQAKCSHRFGKAGIVITTADGKKVTGDGLRMLSLNPALFEVPLHPPIAGRDFTLQDIASPAEYQVAQYVAAHNRCTWAEIAAATGFSKVFIRERMYLLNKKAQEWMGTTAIDNMRIGVPSIYRINEGFARAFSMKVTDAPLRKGVFSEDEWNLVTFVHEHPDRTSSTVLKQLLWSYRDYQYTLKQMRRRYAAFGIEPFDAGEMRRHRLRLSSALQHVLGLEEVEKKELEDYFTPTQARILRCIAENPWFSRPEIAAIVRLRKNQFNVQVREIGRIMKRHGLPGLEIRRRAMFEPFRYRLPTAFCQRFGLPTVKPAADPDMLFLLASPENHRIYEFFSSHPDATIADAAGALGIRTELLERRLAHINGYLRKHGKAPLDHARRYLFNHPNFVILNLRAYRKVFGRWPDEQQLRDAEDRYTLARIGEHFGSFDDALAAARKKRLRPDRKRIERIRNDYYKLKAREAESISRMRLHRFGRMIGDVRQAAHEAVVERGIPLAQAREIIQSAKSAARTIEKLDALRGWVPKNMYSIL